MQHKHHTPRLPALSGLLRTLPATLILIAALCGVMREAAAIEYLEIRNNSNELIFDVRLYSPTDGPFASGETSEWTLGDNEIQSIRRALEYWVERIYPTGQPEEAVIIHVGALAGEHTYGSDIVDFNWNATGSPVLYLQNPTTIVGAPEFILVDNIPIGGDFHALIRMGEIPLRSFDLNTQLNANVWNYESIMIHEMGHALGILSATQDEAQSRWTQLLTGAVHTSTREFSGAIASAVYGDVGRGNTSLLAVARGVPVDVDDSHFDVFKGNMTHQQFRNYSGFMEVELAALQDLGYTIDRRNFFGRSVYVDGQTIDNYDGFWGRNELGTAYIQGTSNLSSYGLGLHVFANNTTLVQKADILADGVGGCGIRTDGVQNHITVARDVKIHANGERGIGLLTSYGYGSVIIHQGEIQANGSNGVGVRFDIGANLLTGDRASYQPGILELDGPMVERFDISGAISGTAAAIYLSSNAHVEEINFMDPNGKLAVSGNIISEYVASDSEGNARTTKLAFGKAADAATGESTTVGDANFDFAYDGIITGKGNFSLETWGGRTSLRGVSFLYTGLVGAGTAASELNIHGGVSFRDHLEIAANGILSGTGVVVAENLGVLNTGIISPGNGDIDTLTIVGKLTNDTNGILLIDIDPTHGLAVAPTAGVDNDLIRVMGDEDLALEGKAVIEGGTVVVNSPSNDKGATKTPARYAVGSKYVFLKTEDGLDVQQPPDVQTVNPVLLFDFVGDHDANDYWLETKRWYEYGPHGDTYNQKQIGDSIDRMGIYPDPNRDYFDVLVAMDMLNEAAGIPHREGISAEAKFAEDQMSGAIYASLANSSIQNTTIVNNTLTGLLRRGAFSEVVYAANGCGGGCDKGCEDECMCSGKFIEANRNLWALGFGMGGSTKHDGNAYGYGQRFGGTMFGADVYDNDNRLGVFFSYGEGRISSELYDRVESREFLGGLYYYRELHWGYFMANAALGYNRYDTYRHISFLGRKTDNRHGGINGTFYFERGLEFEVSFLRWKPYLGFQYVGNRQNSFLETGAGDVSLNADKLTGKSFRSLLGSHLHVDIGHVGRGYLSFHLNAVWMHEMLDPYSKLNAQFTDLDMSRFTIRGNDIGKDWAILQFGLNHECERISLFAGYDIYMNSHQVLHTGNVGFSLDW